MKTSVLFVIFGLALLLCLSFAAELEDTGRQCGEFMWKCGAGKPTCCSGYDCSPTWKWCVLKSPGRR
uniref:U10-theraphotoxin-Cg1a 2 n=1 Tax=Chilobrachys guangxiensis TaxID=278060 RepID=JZ13B_CHIGU|nr:RecName: Full=U10-theraphotoxin-Cg1a 2; Short=U10-TRTX-Cg1a; AltName: Full=Jingzhaotoxin-13.2; Short=JZTX-13.2; AltName: Full=Peptide F5-18.88; Flags: Precursor [Chilobrachys guangxiensis]ABY71680.1 cystine knot toxin [Chilobrachys guangxiensis]